MKKIFTLVTTTLFIIQIAGAQSWLLTGNAGTSQPILGTTDSNPLNLVTNNTSRMLLDQFGNIGVGLSTAPLFKLDVNGSINLTIGNGIKINGFDILRSSSGSISMGVNSGILNTTSSCIFIGTGSGALSTTGPQNTFVGSGSGAHIVTGNTNAFFGFNAGTNCTGSQNTLMGETAGNSLQSGTNNTFIGKTAGTATTSGNNNVAIGAFANLGTTRSKGIVIGSGASVTRDNCAVIGDLFITKIGFGKTPATANIMEFQITTAKLTTGGAWTNASDRKLKDQISQLEKKDILEKINQLEVARWHYKADETPVTHIGPFAKDFYSAFGTGDDSTISTIDPSGVALIGIQQLSNELNELKIQLELLRKQNTELKIAREKSAESSHSNSYLRQNVPNPFSQITSVSCYVEVAFQSAMLLITDLNGQTKQSYSIDHQGENEIAVSSAELSSGIYLFTLVIDGKPIETKQMVVAK